MPMAILDRIPFPNLRAYTAGSVLALSACVFYAAQTIKDPNWDSAQNDIANVVQNGMNTTNSSVPDGRTMRKYMGDIFTVLVREPICVWTMINMAFCWLILIGTAIQKLVFGELRVSEQQHLKDKFWNFIFYKFIFVFGIINVQYIDEVLLWCSWFSFLGFLHLLSQLSNDRFEYLSFSPTTPVWNHVKLLALLGVIFALSGFMLLVAVFVGFFGGINTFAFMAAEVVLLSVRTLHIIIKYALHLYDMRHESALPIVPNEENKVWERRGPVIYYTELTFEMVALVIDFVHHLHMLIWSNIFLSMASLVICMQMRYLFQEIQRKYKKHRNYLWVRNHLELNYPMASSAELAENSDNCAVCWEKMEGARKLPCGHLFHNTCLLSWLEQDTTCPTCRMALNIQNPAVTRIESPDLQIDPPQIVRRQLNHFFHFDGSRYVSWLPSFSVEVTHAQLVRQEALASNSQLDAMARQVQELFPNMPISVITDDLRSTRSVEQTVENVLDGRLVVPPIFREPEATSVRRPTGVLHPPPTAAFNSEDISTKNWEEYNTEAVETDDTASLGSRFSKSSQEREKILQKRKENLLHRARKRYIERRRANQTCHTDLES